MTGAEFSIERLSTHYELVTEQDRAPGIIVAEKDAVGEVPPLGVSFLQGELRFGDAFYEGISLPYTLTRGWAVALAMSGLARRQISEALHIPISAIERELEVVSNKVLPRDPANTKRASRAGLMYHMLHRQPALAYVNKPADPKFYQNLTLAEEDQTILHMTAKGGHVAAIVEATHFPRREAVHNWNRLIQMQLGIDTQGNHKGAGRKALLAAAYCLWPPEKELVSHDEEN